MTRIAATACWVVLTIGFASACFTGDITGGGSSSDGGGGDDGDPGTRPLAVSPPQVTLAPGTTQTFTAARSGTSVTAVTWSVAEGDAGGTISGDGAYTAPATEGTYTVVATETASGEHAEATVTVAQLAATTHGMAIPAGHPRLWFNPSRLARAKAWFQTHPFTAPSSEDSGGGYGDTALHGLLSDNAGGACTRAITWGLSRLGDVDDSGGTACDSCRWTGEQLILIYDWCYAYFTPTQRATYVAGVSTGLQAWSRKSWGGPGMFQNNYYWGYLRNELEWSITAYDENPAWAEAMLDWVFTNRLQNGFNPSTAPGGASRGGVASEGSEYGPVVGAYPLVPFVTANLLGRNIYEETPFWRESVYALIYATTPAPTRVPDVTGMGYTVFPFSDDEGWNSRFQAQTHYFPDFMTTMASYWPTQNVGRHARQWATMVGITPWRHVQAVDVPTTPLAFDALPLDFYASGPRYLYGRSAWGPSGTVFMAQLGDAAEDTIGHQHGDYGTFQIWRGGRFLSHESAAYAGSGNSEVVGYAGNGSVDGALGIAHNSVLIDGVSPGPQYSGPAAVVERLESRPGYTFAVVDLVPPATRMAQWRRELVFVRGLETLVVLDRIETTAAGATKTFLNHCETSPVVSGNSSATCTVDTQALTMTTLLPAQRAYRVVDEGAHPYSQYRIEVDTTPGTTQSYILNVLEARGAADAPLTPTVADNGTSYTVTLDASTSITFQKGMTSTGGTIRIGGVDTPLRAGVQTMSVTGDGPSWAP